MSTLNEARQPSLKDKLTAQESALKAEADSVSEELAAVKKAKKRASKR